MDQQQEMTARQPIASLEAANRLTEKIMGCAIETDRHFAPGLLEGIYESAVCVEFARQGGHYQRQVAIPISYHEKPIGEHRLRVSVA